MESVLSGISFSEAFFKALEKGLAGNRKHTVLLSCEAKGHCHAHVCPMCLCITTEEKEAAVHVSCEQLT